MAKPLTPDDIERARQMALDATQPGGAMGSITELARRTGYNRATVSLFVSGKYDANPTAVARAVLFQLDRLVCPFIADEIHPDICTRRRSAPKPFGNPEKLAYWTACQACPNNPDAKE